MTKTVSITLPDEDYDALKELAEKEDRYISGQARHMLRRELKHRQMVEAALRNPQPGEHQPAVHQNRTSATSDTPAISEAAQQEPLPG